jgi:hypothetical protein
MDLQDCDLTQTENVSESQARLPYDPRPTVHQIDDTVAVDRHVLLRYHFDRLLSDHAPKESGGIGQLRGRRS